MQQVVGRQADRAPRPEPRRIRRLLRAGGNDPHVERRLPREGVQRQIERRGNFRHHGDLRLQARLGLLERRRHVEDDLSRLDRDNAPCRHRSAVPVALDLKQRRPVRVSRPEKVAVQRVRQSLRRHRRPGSGQGLRGDLPAEQGPILR